MNDELATDVLIAYGVATGLSTDFSELINVFEDGGGLDEVAAAVEELRLRKDLIERCGMDSSEHAPLKITSVAELKDARDAVNSLIHKEYLPELMSDSPQLSNLNVMPYVDGAIAYGNAHLAEVALSELKTQSTKMTLAPAVRLEALKKLPLALLEGADARLDFAAVQRAVEEVVDITGTETFEPPSDFMDYPDSLRDAERTVRRSLRTLVNSLMIDFASDSSRPNPLRTSTSYLLAYCKVGQEMSGANDLSIDASR